MGIRAASFEEWMKNTFDVEEIKDIVVHGADSGWQGLTYYKDTMALYHKFNEEIWEALYEDCQSLGNKNIMEMVSQFGCADAIANDATFQNALVWYMAERIARQLTE